MSSTMAVIRSVPAMAINTMIRSTALACRPKPATTSIPIRSAASTSEGHNYFLSQNPYVLNSYAGFGEAYYNVLPDLKLTGGMRWTDDQKHFIDIPSELLAPAMAIWPSATVDQQWNEVDRPLCRQLDAQARFHRSDADLWLLCPWLQGGRRQSAGRGACSATTAAWQWRSHSSADLQAGIRGCL